MTLIGIISIVFLFSVTLSGCVVDHSPVQRDASVGLQGSVSIPQTTRLAGTWEYEEDGLVYLVTLDSQGNGTYDWQDGKIMTSRVSDDHWAGTWHQAKNDREGEFELRLSEDRQSAEGRWWYTRIGDDQAPTQSGGTFHITRLDASQLAEFSQ